MFLFLSQLQLTQQDLHHIDELLSQTRWTLIDRGFAEHPYFNAWMDGLRQVLHLADDGADRRSVQLGFMRQMEFLAGRGRDGADNFKSHGTALKCSLQ